MPMTPAPSSPAITDRGRWIALVVLCVGVLMIILDSTVVNVALPAIQRDLGFSQANLAWVVNAYLISFGGLLLLALILASGMIWLISRSRYIPYVVEVDKLGYALTVPQPLTPASVPDVTARMQRYEVAAFIRDARSVTSDPLVEHQMLNSLLAHARGAADRFLDAYYHSDSFTHNPFKLAENCALHQAAPVAIRSTGANPRRIKFRTTWRARNCSMLCGIDCVASAGVTSKLLIRISAEPHRVQ